MKRIVWICIVLCLLFIFGRIFYNTYTHRYCLKNSYDISYITSTILTLGKKTKDGHIWLMRGKIENFSERENYVFGYLSIKYFKEDKLIGFEGINDKEGYFIVNVETGKLESGLPKKIYSKKIKEYLNIKIEDIKYRDFPLFSLSCLFK